MASVLSALSTQPPRGRSRVPGAFGRRRIPSLGQVIMAALGRAYRAAQEAQMRRIRMQLALHGVDRDDDEQAPVKR